jgi:hypothetical protein
MDLYLIFPFEFVSSVWHRRWLREHEKKREEGEVEEREREN